MSYIDGKTILITGGTGSFGQKFVEIILKEHNPKAIRIFSRGEFLQYEMQKRIQDDRLRFLIGDVREERRIFRAMNGVDVVVHTAALKQVSACEYNPMEAVRTNIEGTTNVIDSAINNKVSKVLAISTDKAVHPVNLYGGTKLVLEKLCIQANVYSANTRLSCVRYGNVAGSRGSVIPSFLEESKTGQITITDPRMTRFWMTLEKGVRFAIDCIDMMEGGEIFVPRLPSMKIVDLAAAVNMEAKINFIGIRPGEKLHEILVTQEESRHAMDCGEYFTIYPEMALWRGKEDTYKAKGMALKQDFEYTSDGNKWWLSSSDLVYAISEFRKWKS